jgi:hypothetical protein
LIAEALPAPEIPVTITSSLAGFVIFFSSFVPLRGETTGARFEDVMGTCYTEEPVGAFTQ